MIKVTSYIMDSKQGVAPLCRTIVKCVFPAAGKIKGFAFPADVEKAFYLETLAIDSLLRIFEEPHSTECADGSVSLAALNAAIREGMILQHTANQCLELRVINLGADYVRFNGLVLDVED